MTKEKQIARRLHISDFESRVSVEDYPVFFSEAEIKRYAKRKGKGGLAARYLIKEILHDEGIIPDDFRKAEILSEESGKPFLRIENHAKEELPKIHFSLSHTKNEVAVIVVLEYA